jgi:hypothetical protein
LKRKYKKIQASKTSVKLNIGEIRKDCSKLPSPVFQHCVEEQSVKVQVLELESMVS